MTSHSHESPSMTEMCDNVKKLGYGISQRVRLYGEEFVVVSDPFPDAGGIAVHARTNKASDIRVVRLPSTVVQSVARRTPEAA